MEWILTLLISGWWLDVSLLIGVCIKEECLSNESQQVMWLSPLPGLCVPSFCADYRQHCLIETPKSWLDAQRYCRERGYDLATIDDMGAMKSLLGLSADRAHDELWIGLHYGGHKVWCWSQVDKDYYQEGGRKYRNFQGQRTTTSAGRLLPPSLRASKGRSAKSQLFSVLGPQWWNELPAALRTAESLAIFRKRLKTHLFRVHLDSA